MCNNFGKRLGEKLSERLNEGLRVILRGLVMINGVISWMRGKMFMVWKALNMLYECFKYALDELPLVAASESWRRPCFTELLKFLIGLVLLNF